MRSRDHPRDAVVREADDRGDPLSLA